MMFVVTVGVVCLNPKDLIREDSVVIPLALTVLGCVVCFVCFWFLLNIVTE